MYKYWGDINENSCYMIGLVHKTNSLEQPRTQHTAAFLFLVIVIVIIQGQESSQSFQVFWNALFSSFLKKKPAGKLVWM
jgi:hypothetical protein